MALIALTAAPQNLTASTANTATQRTSQTPSAHPHLPEGTEIRGFALYVGLSEDKLDPNDPNLGAIVTQIKQLVAQLAPAAETYAAVALAPEGAGGRDVDVVRVALGDPAAQPRQKPELDPELDRAASGVVLDLSRKRVLLDNIPAALTFREFELLQFLVLREGLTVSREEIIETLWADAEGEDIPSERTIDVHVRRLRVKLAHYQDIVRTVRGIGYRFDRHADVSILQPTGPSPDFI